MGFEKLLLLLLWLLLGCLVKEKKLAKIISEGKVGKDRGEVGREEGEESAFAGARGADYGDEHGVDDC